MPRSFVFCIGRIFPQCTYLVRVYVGMHIVYMSQDPVRVIKSGYDAAIKLAVDRMKLYFEDAETCDKLTKNKNVRKRSAGRPFLFAI